MYRWVVALVAWLALTPGLAEAKWLRAESPRFVVFSNGDEMVLRRYVETLEAFDSLLRLRHNLPVDGVPSRKLPIYLVRNTEELQRTYPGSRDTIAGYYSSSLSDIFAVAIRERDDDSTLKHEYVHHFMKQNFAGAYPAWFIEGFAEYYGPTLISPTHIEVGRFNGRVNSVRYGGDIAMADLLGKRVTELPGEQIQAFYGNAWLLTHYLLSDPVRFEKAQDYLSAVAQGASPVTAMETATGMDTATLAKTLKTYFGGSLNYTSYPRSELKFAAPTVSITTLPPSADAVLLESLSLHRGADENQAGWARIKAAAAQYPEDRLATVTAARAEIAYGDKAAGIRQLEAWLKRNPQDTEVMIMIGEALYEQLAEASDAKAQLTRAEAYVGAALDRAPTDYRALAYAGLIVQAQDGGPNSTSQDLLLQAFQQARQVAEIRVALGRTLIARNQAKAAVVVLKPLANDPHGGSAARWARDTLATLDSQAR